MLGDLQNAQQSWSAPLAVDFSLCLVALIYCRGWFRLRTAFPELLPPWKLASFCCGLSCVWLAIASPLAALDDFSLTVHMIQHLLLLAIAPALLLLGAPELPLLRGIPQPLARRVAAPILRSPPVKRVGGWLTHPAVGWLAAASALMIWHIPIIFERALRSEGLHKLEHFTFLAAGFLFWWPVIQPWPSTARWPRWALPAYLFAATLPCDILSGFLAFCDRVVYPSYLVVPSAFNLTPLQDQQCAAALMWVCTTFILAIPAVIITTQILSPQKSKVQRPFPATVTRA